MSARGKRARENQVLREAEQRFGEDTSTVLHTFEDGWTIRRPSSISDVRREGTLMKSCLADHPGNGGVASDDPQLQWWLDVATCSLRDERNFPHVTFAHFNDTGVLAEGRTNSVPKPQYMARINDWLATLPPPEEQGTLPSPEEQAQHAEVAFVVGDDGGIVFENELELLDDDGGQLFYYYPDGNVVAINHACYVNAPVFAGLGITAKAHIAAITRLHEFSRYLEQRPGLIAGLTTDEAKAAAVNAMDGRVLTEQHVADELGGLSREELLGRLAAES